MTPDEAAEATATPIGQLSSLYMLDPATYETGGELGFEGMDFYIAGRGGALGPVTGDVVAAAFVFFDPETVRARWEVTRAIMTPEEAALAWVQAGRTWALGHLADDLDAARLAELAGTVVQAANPAGAPLFAGWRGLPEPTEAKALALHRMNALRELRNGLHGGAVLAAGMTPLEAVLVRTPYMAGIFGWTEPYPEPAPSELWDAAEQATDRAMARLLTVLDAAERAELAALAGEALATVS